MSMDFRIQIHNAVADIGREAWDACASPSGDPFLSFDFLDACEASGSAVPEQGWAGRHLSLVDETGRVLGVMPLWLKGHSQGDMSSITAGPMRTSAPAAATIRNCCPPCPSPR
jgi:predicted N-acyltransferase